MPDSIQGTAAYQGPRVSDVPPVADLSEKLIQLGITHVGQLIGTAGVAESVDRLSSFLGIPSDGLNRLLTRVKKTLPSAVASLYDGEAFALPGLGGLLPTEEMKVASAALPLMPPAAGALPDFISLISDFPPTRDQGARGTCAAFGVTALNEYYRQVIGTPQDLSEEYLFFMAKQIDNAPTAPGTWVWSACRAMEQYGECRESVWPYNPGFSPADTLRFSPKPAGADADAARFRCRTRQLNPTDVAGVKSSLASGYPVAINFPVYNSWFKSADTVRTGRITMPLPGEQPFAGHVVCLVGYKDDALSPGGGFFILRNQWQRVGLELGGQPTSVFWAELSQFGQGYGTIPYAYIGQLNQEAYALAESVDRGTDTRTGDGTTRTDNIPDQVDRIRSDFDDMLRQVTSLAAGAAKAGAAPGVGARGGSSVISAGGRITIEMKDGTRLTLG